MLLRDQQEAPIRFYSSKNLVAKRVIGWKGNLLDRHLTRYLSIARLCEHQGSQSLGEFKMKSDAARTFRGQIRASDHPGIASRKDAYWGESEMIASVRTAIIAPGKNGGAMVFARQVSTYIKEKHKTPVEVSIAVAGNPSRIAWRSTYASLAEMETFTNALLADPAYAELLVKGADLFLPGSLHDEIWRAV